MKFQFKSIPVPKASKKYLPKGATNTAFKVRRVSDKEVLGTVLHSEIEGGEIWGYFREGKVFGGYQDKVSAAEGLASS
jgi:hypothetical protein